MNPQELILTLKAQHHTLQADLASAMEDLQSESILNTENILSYLNKFNRDLIDHMKLEGGVFYADYLNKKIQRGEDVTSTKEFIRKMDEIAKTIRVFLEKYSTTEKISMNLIEFRKELQNIIQILNLRIETEEEGIFELYLLM